jgi:DNA-binding MarR family transcriptional regulator
MEKEALITKIKKVVGNGRVTVKLTEKGEEALRLSSERKFLLKVMSGLTPEQTQQLETCLEFIRDNAVNLLDIQEKQIVPPSKVSKYYQNK